MHIDENHPFFSFGLSEAMLQAITKKGWTAPSSIQGIALPRLLADKGHCIVKARTGTGKTAAFGIPLIEKITQAGHAPRALILVPTRELALQVTREIASLVSGNYPRITAVYGGASMRSQITDLRRGTEIAVGTPGRIIDLMERKALDLSEINWFILDEADEMLDMGFFEDVEKILETAKAGKADNEDAMHIALFSATMPEPILKTIRKHIGDPEIIVDSAPEEEKHLVDQFCVIVRREDRLEALRRIIDNAEKFYGLIFCATKIETDELARRLVEAGYPAEAIHGDLSQEIRERTLRRFRQRRYSLEHKVGAYEPAILVATDVAARGLDIESLSHVINWDLPGDRETYIHRIGRTARAGRQGIAITFAALANRDRIHQFSRIAEKNLGNAIQWLKVPSVKAVMKTLRRRIYAAAVNAIPAGDALPEEPALTEARFAEARLSEHSAMPAEALPPPETNALPDTASPFLDKVCRGLIDQLGAEKAVQALVTLSFGNLFDPARYGPITEFTEKSFLEPIKPAGKSRGSRKERFSHHFEDKKFKGGGRKHSRSKPQNELPNFHSHKEITRNFTHASPQKNVSEFSAQKHKGHKDHKDHKEMKNQRRTRKFQ